MEDKGGCSQGDGWTEWFAVLKVPILKITIDDQVFFFSPTRRVNTPGELLKVLKEDAWRIINSEKAYQAKFYETARLFDYLNGQEATISVAVLTAEACWKQHREKAKQLPIKFHVTLHDKIWNKEKEITSQGLIEIYRVQAEVRIAPSQGVQGYRQEAIIEGKKLVRLHGLFATDNEPFTPENDPILNELFKQASLNSDVPRIKSRGDKKNLSGYMDITFFLKE